MTNIDNLMGNTQLTKQKIKAMKQVININFQGRVVPIEVTAFELLKNYTESLNKHFAAEVGKEEIINDIESRIGELFQERLKNGATCITDDDVNAVIKSMGRPEEFEDDDNSQPAGQQTTSETHTQQNFYNNNANANTHKRLYRDESNKVLGGVCSGIANYFNIDALIVRILFVVSGVGFLAYVLLWAFVPGNSAAVIGGPRKKLYRDGDDKIVAGVCSGIGNYFGMSAWIPRILFLLPFLSFVFRWGHWGMMDFPNFLRVGFSPGALIIYIILWLVIPEAFTTTEKLEMKGERVDMNTIKNSVMEEIKGVQQRAQKFGKEATTVVGDTSKVIASEAGNVARRSSRSLGDIIVFLLKIFAYFIVGVVGFALVVAMFTLAVFSITVFPLKDFLVADGWQNVYAWGTLLFFIGIPVIGIITWIIRKLVKAKAHSRMIRLSFGSLWVIGWVCFIMLLSSVSRDFKATNTINEQEVSLSNPKVNKLELTSVSSLKKYYRYNWFRLEPFEGMEEDTAYLKNVEVVIVKSSNDSFRVTMVKMVNGRTRHAADTLARLMEYNVEQKDSLLLLDKGIPITRTDKFRNQRIVLTVYVPVGKQIRVNRNVGWGQNIHFNGPWNSNDWNFNIEVDDAEHGWDEDEDYIMKADGLYTLDGYPADGNKERKQRVNNGKIQVRDGNTKVTMDRNGITVDENAYRYDNNSSAPTRVDSLKQKQEQEKQRLKDSLQKASDKINKQLDKLNENNDPLPLAAYNLPVFNPILNMN